MHTRGIDHLAIVGDDMPTALDFYTRVMGFRFVHARRVPFEADRWQPPYDNLRHYFFDMGNDSLFAIFEYPKGLARQNRDHVGAGEEIVESLGRMHRVRVVPPPRGIALHPHHPHPEGAKPPGQLAPDRTRDLGRRAHDHDEGPAHRATLALTHRRLTRPLPQRRR